MIRQQAVRHTSPPLPSPAVPLSIESHNISAIFVPIREYRRNIFLVVSTISKVNNMVSEFCLDVDVQFVQFVQFVIPKLLF
jgi:hypothetical protein